MEIIQDLLDSSEPFTVPSDERSALNKLLQIAIDLNPKDIGITLAALFDLLIGFEYYRDVTNTKWTYCNNHPNLLIYPFVNVCPRCLGEKKFVYAEGKKPSSGVIGKNTTRILLLLLQIMFARKKRDIQRYRAKEPIDTIIYDKHFDRAIIAEIKAAPLLTVPLAVFCEEQSELLEGEKIPLEHSQLDCPFWNKLKTYLYFPKSDALPEYLYPINIGKPTRSRYFIELVESVTNKAFLYHYLIFWRKAFEAYGKKDHAKTVFWLTNACGSPADPPENWPIRKTRGGGLVTVSDAKSSVGMDRTDDIKKGIYQVLKLGAVYKPKFGKGRIKTALLSNVHAVRHYEEYFLTLHDIVWLKDEQAKIKSVSDIPLDTPIYNLFDGVLSFTESTIRDDFILDLFSFNG